MTSKYHSIPTEVDGIRFASRLEARRYAELKILEKAGRILDLCLQVKFPLMVGFDKIGDYVADFVYQCNDRERTIVEDAKGNLTPIFRWKAKHMTAQGNPVTLWPPKKPKTRKKKP